MAFTGVPGHGGRCLSASAIVDVAAFFSAGVTLLSVNSGNPPIPLVGEAQQNVAGGGL